MASVLHICGMTAALALFGWAGSAQAVVVTQLDLTGGSSTLRWPISSGA